MREFEKTLVGKELAIGLRRNYLAPRNMISMLEAQNVKVTEDGLVIYEPLNLAINAASLIGSGIELSFPYPQIIQGKFYTFITTKNRLYIVNEESDDLYDFTDDIYQINSDSIKYTPKIYRQWQLLDMYKSWALMNGKSLIFYRETANINTAFTDRIRGLEFAQIEAGCEFRGRAFYGGFSEGKFWHSSWRTFFNNWAGDLSKPNDMLNVADNWVFWSNIGVGAFWMFYPTEGQYSLVADGYLGTDLPDRAYIFDLIQRGDLGWRPMPWRGKVLQMIPTKKSVMVYGSGGYTLLYPVVDPVPTMAMFRLNDRFGINNKGAAGGDEEEHVFLDARGCLRYMKFNADGFPAESKKLGYEEWFKNDLDTIWNVSFDPNERYWYISNGVKSFVLTDYGLSSTKQIVTSISYRDELTMCLGGVLDDNTIILTWDDIDLGTPELKDIQWIHVGTDDSNLYEARIQWKVDDSALFSSSEWKPFNDDGACYLNKSAKVFRLSLRVLNPEDVIQPPSWITFTYKLSDKRYRRGINVGSFNKTNA